tara:strand:+ start:187 stop:609 length:423 start_codon:yes stop_codon:yes gene_type:complete
LTQTDTTVGFLSQNDKKLCVVKKRDEKQKILQVVNKYSTLKKLVRIPQKYKKFIRHSKNTTIIYPNTLAFRVVSSESSHQNFLQKFNTMYSTSANKTKCQFDEVYAKHNTDIYIYTKDSFREMKSSSIYKINNVKAKKIR